MYVKRPVQYGIHDCTCVKQTGLKSSYTYNIIRDVSLLPQLDTNGCTSSCDNKA